MDSNEKPIAVPPQEELPDLVEVKKPTSLLVAQFFLFPLIIIAFGVGIFVLFGYMAYEESSPDEYLTVIRSGGGYFDRQRWQAAAQLTTIIAARADELRETPFADQVLEAYTDAQALAQSPDAGTYQDPLMGLLALDPDESQLRRYLAMSLGHLEHTPAVPALAQGLADPNAETQIWTLWALGKIADPSAAPAVARWVEGNDAGVRQMAAYVLGVLKDPATIPHLRIALGDVAREVQWTAAMSLAQLGDPGGSELLVAVTDRAYFADFADPLSEEAQENVITNAVHCLGLLRLDDARDHLVALSQDDPSLKVRDAALAALSLY